MTHSIGTSNADPAVKSELMKSSDQERPRKMIGYTVAN